METDEVLKDMAGPSYLEMMQNRDAALAHLGHPNSDVRVAAITICSTHWNCSRDGEFLNACRRLAARDHSDSVRVSAISVLGQALRSSQDSGVSEFLAALVKADRNPNETRLTAYWALREIQLGLSEEDCVKRSIFLAKSLLRRAQNLGLTNEELKTMGVAKEQAKRGLLCAGKYSEVLWDSAEEIDWNFVNRYGSANQDQDGGTPAQ